MNLIDVLCEWWKEGPKRHSILGGTGLISVAMAMILQTVAENGRITGELRTRVTL